MDTLPAANQAEGDTTTGMTTAPYTTGDYAATTVALASVQETSGHLDTTAVTDDEEDEGAHHHDTSNNHSESLNGMVDHSHSSGSNNNNNNNTQDNAANNVSTNNHHNSMMSTNSHSVSYNSCSDYDDAEEQDNDHEAVMAHQEGGSSELMVQEDAWNNEYSSRHLTGTEKAQARKKTPNRRRSLTSIVRSTKKGFQKLAKRASMEHGMGRSSRKHHDNSEEHTQVPTDVAPVSPGAPKKNKMLLWRRNSPKKRSSLPSDPHSEAAAAASATAAASAAPNMRASVQGPGQSLGDAPNTPRNSNNHPASPFKFRRPRNLSSGSTDAPQLPGMNNSNMDNTNTSTATNTNTTTGIAMEGSRRGSNGARISNGMVKAPVRAGMMMVQGSVRAGLSVTNAVADGGKAVGNTVASSGKAFVEGTTSVVQQTGKAVVGGGKAFVEGTTSVVTQSGKAVVGGGKALVEGTTSVVQQGGKAMVGGATAFVDGGKAFVEGTTSVVHQGGMAMVGGGKAIVEGTTSVVMGGGKTVLSGGMAVVGGTTMVVGMGSKTMAKGAKEVVKGFKRISQQNPLYLMYPPAKRQKTTWEEGIDVIDELLNPSSDTFEAMTSEQRRKLANVKKYLLNQGTSTGVNGTANAKNKTQHIPQELIQLQTLAEQETIGCEDFHSSFTTKDGVGLSVDSLHSTLHGAASLHNMVDQRVGSMGHARRLSSLGHAERRASSMAHARRNSNFILQEYAGVDRRSLLMDMTKIMDDNSSLNEDDESYYDGDSISPESGHVRLSGASAHSTNTDSNINKTSPTAQPPNQEAALGASSASINNLPDKWFVPPELTYMEHSEQVELCQMISWDELSKWNYDIFRLNEITNGHPLLFLGWAILGSPYAHQAVAKEIGLDIEIEQASSKEPQGYTFMDDLSIPPDKLCNYLRTIEQDYSESNPYHNAIHAADVMQTLHSLIQQSRGEDFMKPDNTPKINIFTILLSAAVHDVNHPGTTNAFHATLKTELALMYNDKSILESWHISHAFARMLDLDVRSPEIVFNSQVIFARKQTGRNHSESANNILCNVSEEQFETIRKLMIEAVLHTDMTKHFEMVDAARGMLKESQVEAKHKDARRDRSWRLLIFMLHLADISGQAKGDPLFRLWTDRCLDEFFLQGDEEATLGLPISPNCDRQTTEAAESQLGFIRFVVEPAYEVLGQFIPFVEGSVLPILQHNLDYWFSQTEAAALEDEEAAALEHDEAAALALEEEEGLLEEEDPTTTSVDFAEELVDPDPE